MKPIRAAMTLIETLIVIAVVAIIVSLTLPSLHGARVAAEDAVSLSNLRQHAAVIHAYSIDHDGFFPYLTDPDAETNIIRNECVAAELKYFEVCDGFWNIPLVEAYYDGACRSAAFYHPTLLRERRGGFPGTRTWYFASQCFLADPLFYDEATHRGRSQWRPVRLVETANPSKKGLLIDYSFGLADGFRAREQVGCALTDGSATQVPYQSFIPPWRGGSGGLEGSDAQYPFPILHTQHGVRGRDLP